MKQRLKVSEIAALSGVSISTVSRVLAGKANTRPATRDKSAGRGAATGRT
ncbi:trehalose repressor [Pantoea agglomerans]|uniref:Trehalose repressor n=1 Tax=Enterobacter agglomerans TaxID=549 RepID=A0A379AB06_ENTAG|nr:trehalose repressor [Pantoea agglomerans]